MSMKNIYIFGAHSRARTLKEYLGKVKPELNTLAYLVDNEEKNPETVDGLSVIHLSDLDAVAKLDEKATVYLGVKKVNQPNATEHLRSIGFENLIPLTVELDTFLRNEYIRRVFHERGEHFQKLEDISVVKDVKISDAEVLYNGAQSPNNQMRIYVASSIYDGTLQEHHDFLPFEKVIQVGCSLTEERLGGAVYDNVGDSISDRNKQFCELTALYWIWKNADQAYVGLEHYRRFFIVPQNIVQIMAENRVDVVLPVPLYVAPSVEENYIFRHEPKVWADMLAYLKNHSEEEYHAAKVFFSQGLYSPCNMLIARKEVYDGLCEWMFPILFEVAKKNGTLADRYQNRYPGFLSERLISFFFDYHRKDYRTVYADKVFLQ